MSSKNQDFLKSSNAHLKTWKSFISLSTVGVVVLLAVLSLMAIFLL